MASPAGALAVERAGRGAPVVLVHGFTQTRRCWGEVAPALARHHTVVALDAPGHGGSASAVAPFADSVARVGATGGPGTYLGYSMGGRLALALAVARPDLVERLVLISASPGLDDAHARAERRRSDRALADHIEAVGVEAFLDEWLALPLFAGLDDAAAHLDERRTNTAAGLAGSLRTVGTGEQPSLWGALPRLAVPVLVVTGADDDRFTAVGRRMVESIGPTASLAVVPGAGHTVHLEQPAAFRAHVIPWLAETEPPNGGDYR